MARVLEHLLRLPPLAITLLSIAGALPISPSRTFGGEHLQATVTPIYSPALICSLVIFIWVYALKAACNARTAGSPARHEQIFWPLLAFSGATLFVLSHAAYVWAGSPPTALLTAIAVVGVPAVIGILIAMIMAANALAKFEASATPPGDETPWNPLLPILFIPIGIWFLHGRVERMLDHPRLA